MQSQSYIGGIEKATKGDPLKKPMASLNHKRSGRFWTPREITFPAPPIFG